MCLGVLFAGMSVSGCQIPGIPGIPGIVLDLGPLKEQPVFLFTESPLSPTDFMLNSEVT